MELGFQMGSYELRCITVHKDRISKVVEADTQHDDGMNLISCLQSKENKPKESHG
jgi:hypothetical protein